MELVLASTSPIRGTLLANAGVAYAAEAQNWDYDHLDACLHSPGTTVPKTKKGWKVALLTIWPARVSSVKPMIEASDVPLISCTRNPTVGAVAVRMACGSTTWRMRSP